MTWGRTRARDRSRGHGGRAASPLLASFDFTALSPGAVASLPAGLSFSRASSATVQTSATTLVTGLGTDVARAGSDGTHAGLELEESRFNLQRNDHALDLWTIQSGVVVTANTVASPDGTTDADTLDLSGVVTNSGLGAYQLNTHGLGNNAPIVLSAWVRAASGTPTIRVRHPGTGVQQDSGTTTAWARYALATNTGVVSTAGVQLCAGSNVAFYGYGGQCENGAFPTSLILTGGASATRAGERLYAAAGAPLVSSGRVSMYAKLQPKGSSSAYGANMRLWTIDANNYAEVDHTARTVVVVQGGASYTTAGAMTWAAGDTVEVWVAAGGGSLATVVEYRVNAGSWTVLSTGSPPTQAAFTASGAVDLLTNGTAQQFSAWVQVLEFWASGQKHAGVL